MSTAALDLYIKTMMQKGKSIATIRQALTKASWSQAAIDQEFAALGVLTTDFWRYPSWPVGRNTWSRQKNKSSLPTNEEPLHSPSKCPPISILPTLCESKKTLAPSSLINHHQLPLTVRSKAPSIKIAKVTGKQVIQAVVNKRRQQNKQKLGQKSKKNSHSQLEKLQAKSIAFGILLAVVMILAIIWQVFYRR